MCGIIAYQGSKQAAPVLVDGLRRLEYRGYDSAGIAVQNDAGIQVVRVAGRISELSRRLAEETPKGTCGMGHTRWATHGGPSEDNAHPHRAGAVSVVHNGIIENHPELRRTLLGEGRTFRSETDTEVLPHLIDRALSGTAASLLSAVQATVAQVTGSYALVAMSASHPGQMVAARRGSPLVLGLGDGELLLASDVPAILNYTRRVAFLEDGDIIQFDRGTARVYNRDGVAVERPVRSIAWSIEQAEKNGYDHFMLKEINEQPRAVQDTIQSQLGGDQKATEELFLKQPPRRIKIVGCGSSFHAGLVGQHLIERLAKTPCDVELASEFRYRQPILDRDDVVIAISQSGETADTLAAATEAKKQGSRLVAVTNVVDSALSRLADATIYTHAGPEIGVASTKCFTAQLAALVCFAVRMGTMSRRLDPKLASRLARALLELPAKMRDTIGELTDPARIASLGRQYHNARGFLVLARGVNYPIALEGALKLQEISYIMAHGHAAGEMKHGPIALIASDIPVIVIAGSGSQHQKVLSNLAEVRARHGHVIAVAETGDGLVEAQVQHLLLVPQTEELIQPFLTVLPLQVLSYALAIARGNDVDRPRHLAKTVTVE